MLVLDVVVVVVVVVVAVVAFQVIVADAVRRVSSSLAPALNKTWKK